METRIITQVYTDSNAVTCNNDINPISHQIVIGRDPWIMKIDTAIVEVNPIVIDKQTDDIVKDVLCALNGVVLEEWKRFYGRQQNVPEM